MLFFFFFLSLLFYSSSSYYYLYDIDSINVGVGNKEEEEDIFYYFINCPGESSRYLKERMRQRKITNDYKKVSVCVLERVCVC